MTGVVVHDASCLIDLRKGGLLAVLRNLPYRFVVPLPVRESEVLDFSEEQWQQLDDAGMITHDLTPDEIARALALGMMTSRLVVSRGSRKRLPKVTSVKATGVIGQSTPPSTGHQAADLVGAGVARGDGGVEALLCELGGTSGR